MITKKYLLLILVSISFTTSIRPQNISNDIIPVCSIYDKGMDKNAVELAQEMGIGWNLGNTLEACHGMDFASETLWKNPKASKRIIDGVKAAGFKTIRIPCAWNGYIEDQKTYKIKDSWLARVKEVVDYCIYNDMYAIINIHWDGGWLEENPTYEKQVEVNAKQKALWLQIATYFQGYGEHLLFAGTNEVRADYNTPSYENLEVQMSYNQTFVDAVRSTGGQNKWRNLIIQAYNTNINHAIDFLKMPVDPTPNRMMVEVHYYDPYEFCLKEDSSIFEWNEDDDSANRQFSRMKSHFVDKGIPVILGEYGAILRTSLAAEDYKKHIESRNRYLYYVTKAALANKLIPIYWDNGVIGNNGFGLFDRNTGRQIHKDAISAIIITNE